MTEKKSESALKKMVSKLTGQAEPPDAGQWEKRFNAPPFVQKFAEASGERPIFEELHLVLTEKFLSWLARESGATFLLPQERAELERLQAKLDKIQEQRDAWHVDQVKKRLRQQANDLRENPAMPGLQHEDAMVAEGLHRRHVLHLERNEIYAQTNSIGSAIATRIIDAARAVANRLLEAEKRDAEETGLTFSPSQKLLLTVFVGRGSWRQSHLGGMNAPKNLLCGILSWA